MSSEPGTTLDPLRVPPWFTSGRGVSPAATGLTSGNLARSRWLTCCEQGLHQRGRPSPQIRPKVAVLMAR